MAVATRRFGDRFEMIALDAPDRLEDFHVFAISATSQDYARAVQMATTAKQKHPGLVTIIGGNHITHMPETMASCFDLGVVGEGEETFSDLVSCFLDRGTVPDPEVLKQIPGLILWENGRLHHTPARQLIEPLDNVPHPLRVPDKTQYIFTSRGCPYKCAFCSSRVFWGKTRFFSADYVVEEIEQILDSYPETAHIPFMDDLFIADRKRLERIISLLENKGLSRAVQYSFSVRANLVSGELCELLKRLLIGTVNFGAESASDRILEILKKQTTGELNQKALDILYKHGIPTTCSFIIGVPTETEEEVRATYDFLCRNISEGKLSPHSAVNILMPLPGTPIWDYAVEHGMINVSDLDWRRLAVFASYHHSSVDRFEDWIAAREENSSLYLNEETLPQKRLYEIMAEQEARIRDILVQRQKYRKTVRFKMGRFIRRNILKKDPD